MNTVEKPKAKAGQAFLELLNESCLDTYVGQEISLSVRACNANGEDLIGALIVLESNGAVVAEAMVAIPDEFADADDTPPDLRQTAFEFAVATFEFQAPGAIGLHKFEIVFRAQELREQQFEEARLSFEVKTDSQPTSMAVWDLPTPIIVGQIVRFKAGVRSHDGFSLAGQQLKVLSGGEVIAKGVLGDTPLSGTEGLYWTELQAKGLESEGSFVWTVVLEETEAQVAHRGCSTEVSLRVIQPPDCTLTVVVTNRSGHPIAGARVSPGPFSGITESDGVATILVTRGPIDMSVMKDGYAYWTGACEGASERQIVIELDAEKEDEEPIWI